MFLFILGLVLQELLNDVKISSVIVNLSIFFNLYLLIIVLIFKALISLVYAYILRTVTFS